jgi:catalase
MFYSFDVVVHSFWSFSVSCRYNSGDEDNFSQPTLFWRNVLKPDERDRLVQNIADSLKDAADFIQVCFNTLITALHSTGSCLVSLRKRVL